MTDDQTSGVSPVVILFQGVGGGRWLDQSLKFQALSYFIDMPPVLVMPTRGGLCGFGLSSKPFLDEFIRATYGQLQSIEVILFYFLNCGAVQDNAISFYPGRFPDDASM